ncbi:60S acidic ribosomal protein P0-like [Zingiber officinale]|uniref:60S acidic ribosomal protein P0-like n=1 Tax=Zingiber officinale TaxID=94328 RepID=UPI001C4B776A|nr:60S acidic ribosomal protein P0-like [Zingiber officinale]
MVVKLSKAEKKVRYDKKLCSLLDEYGKVLITAADNVGSNQLQSIRRGLRGDSVILMGKNTLIRRCIRFHTEKTGNKDFLNLLPLLGNVGLIFTKGDLKEVSEEVAKYKLFYVGYYNDQSFGSSDQYLLVEVFHFASIDNEKAVKLYEVPLVKFLEQK